MENHNKINFAPAINLRMTKQRTIIYEELCKLYTHPTADEIYRIVKKKLPKVSLGTVYRNLEILSNKGVVKKLELGLNQRRYDGNVHRHYHVRCLKCGVLKDLPDHVVSFSDDKLKESCDFVIKGHDLEFFGLCPKCKENGMAKKINDVS